MSLTRLMALSGALETLIGALVVIAPALVVSLLLGVPADTVAVVLARFFGAGILSLGLAALSARSHVESPAGLGVTYAMTCYNFVAAMLLIWAAAVIGMGGLILWAAGIGHAALGLLFVQAFVRLHANRSRQR
jgi:hypothetical protein